MQTTPQGAAARDTHGLHAGSDTVDAVIVGAGVSGLTTAALLAGRGLSVVVLEARDRIGGRLNSVRGSASDGTARITDLGASWIHGIIDSPLYEACLHFGMPMREFTVGSYQPGGRPIAYFDPEGRRMSDAAANAFISDVEGFNAALDEAIAASRDGDSYADAVNAALASLAWDADRSARVREFHQHRSEEQYGAWHEDLDAHGLDDDWFEGDEVVFPSGYAELATHLEQRMRAGRGEVRLELGAVVSTVARGRRGARVLGTGSDGVPFEVPARHVVITVPVPLIATRPSPSGRGVAGGGSEQGELGLIDIDPPLPDETTRVLEGLTMNRFEKVFLRFRERFWGEGLYAIRQQGPAGTAWHSWYDLTEISGEPTLLTFAAGPTGEHIAGLSHDEVAQAALAALGRLYPESTAQFTSAEVTNWQADPFARGSYPFAAIGTRESDRDALADPIDGVVHLSGEATWGDDPATVTAALMSGHRASERVLGKAIPVTEIWLGANASAATARQPR